MDNVQIQILELISLFSFPRFFFLDFAHIFESPLRCREPKTCQHVASEVGDLEIYVCYPHSTKHSLLSQALRSSCLHVCASPRIRSGTKGCCCFWKVETSKWNDIMRICLGVCVFFDNESKMFSLFFHNGSGQQTHRYACKTKQSSQRGCSFLKRNQSSFRLYLGFPIREAPDLGWSVKMTQNIWVQKSAVCKGKRTESWAAFPVSLLSRIWWFVGIFMGIQVTFYLWHFIESWAHLWCMSEKFLCYLLSHLEMF